MDPLSEVLALMKPQVYVSGGFAVPGGLAIQFPKHQGIKCYAMLSGQCWLVVEGVPEPVLLDAGDCFLLPRGLRFRLATGLSLEPVPYADAFARLGMRSEASGPKGRSQRPRRNFETLLRILFQSPPARRRL